MTFRSFFSRTTALAFLTRLLFCLHCHKTKSEKRTRKISAEKSCKYSQSFGLLSSQIGTFFTPPPCLCFHLSRLFFFSHTQLFTLHKLCQKKREEREEWKEAADIFGARQTALQRPFIWVVAAYLTTCRLVPPPISRPLTPLHSPSCSCRRIRKSKKTAAMSFGQKHKKLTRAAVCFTFFFILYFYIFFPSLSLPLIPSLWPFLHNWLQISLLASFVSEHVGSGGVREEQESE